MPHHSEYKPVPDHLKVQEMLSNCKVMSSKATLQVSVKALFTERMTFSLLWKTPSISLSMLFTGGSADFPLAINYNCSETLCVMGHWSQLTQSGVSTAVMSAPIAVATRNIHKELWLTRSLNG